MNGVEQRRGSDEIEAVAETLLVHAATEGVAAKALGGLACWFAIRHEPEAGSFRRTYGDVDLIVSARGAGKVQSLLEKLGCIANASFNAVQGETRLMFAAPGGHKVDVFVGGFSMSHEVRFTPSAFEQPALHVPLVELLLTKLQTRSSTEKDLSDVASLLAFKELGQAPGEIDVQRLASHLGGDWGLWRTATENLRRIAEWSRGAPLREERIARAAQQLLEAAESVPKSLRWKARARIGERVPWYEDPEEPETMPTEVR